MSDYEYVVDGPDYEEACRDRDRYERERDKALTALRELVEARKGRDEAEVALRTVGRVATQPQAISPVERVARLNHAFGEVEVRVWRADERLAEAWGRARALLGEIENA